jgi:hypothetical protein
MDIGSLPICYMHILQFFNLLKAAHLFQPQILEVGGGEVVFGVLGNFFQKGYLGIPKNLEDHLYLCFHCFFPFSDFNSSNSKCRKSFSFSLSDDILSLSERREKKSFDKKILNLRSFQSTLIDLCICQS